MPYGKARRRQVGKREPYDRVLIVCEGEKTEPRYFDDLRVDLRLASANIVVTGESNPDPLSVVTYGLDLFEDDGEYDRVIFVIDRDTHPENNYNKARRLVTRARKKGVQAYLTVSHPCFEYWILLHFEDSARGYTDPNSPCRQVISDVRKHLPQYGKGMTALYDKTKPNLDDAIERSKRRWKQARSTRRMNPSTRIHQLVTYLQNIRS